MAQRRITLPRPEKELLIEVRSRSWTLERVLAHAKTMTKEVEDAAPRSSFFYLSLATRRKFPGFALLCV
ncbi:MAG TPA: hypothetical protein VGP89_02355, partial [Candidatus Angelobacter sp.]|nr:hypothetical protein [Candidatus Angelobacter sp.]